MAIEGAHCFVATKLDLFECFCVEINEIFVLHAIADLDRVAADLAVFDISLAPN